MNDSTLTRDLILNKDQENEQQDPLKNPQEGTPTEESPQFQLQASPDEASNISQSEEETEKEEKESHTEEKEQEDPTAQAEEGPQEDNSKDRPDDEDSSGEGADSGSGDLGGGRGNPNENKPNGGNEGNNNLGGLGPQAGNEAGNDTLLSPNAQAPKAPQVKQKISLKSKDPASFITSFAAQSPIDMLSRSKEAGIALNSSLQQQKTDLRSELPDAAAFLQFPEAKETKKKRPAFKLSPQAQIDTGEPRKQGDFLNTLKNPAAQPNSRKKIAFSNDQQHFDQQLHSISTVDSSLPNTLGAAPKVSQNGEANPLRLKTMGNSGYQQSKEAKQSANQYIANTDFGENQLLPQPDTNKTQNIPEWKAAKSVELAAEKVPTFDSAVQTNLDQGLKEGFQSKLDKEFQTAATAESTFQQEKSKNSADTQAKLQEQTKIAGDFQENQRGQAGKKINKHKTDWKEENKTLEKTSAWEQHARLMDTAEMTAAQSSLTDKKVKKKYEEADRKAHAKIQQGNQKASDKIREVEKKKEDQSWWDSIKDAIASFLDALSDAISVIFDAVRSAVKAVFDAAIQAVKDIIKKASDWICAQIKGFGEWLKERVQQLLGDYKIIADKFCQLIDAVIDTAVKVIETVADGIAGIVNGLISSLAYLIDGALEILQDVYVGVIKAVHFLLTTDVLEIVKGIFNLGAGIEAMPGHFVGELSEEIMGTNVTTTLEGIERSPAEEDLYKKLMLEEIAKEEEPADETPAATPEIVPEVTSKEVLSQDDAVLQGGTQEMPESLAANFKGLPDGEIELGGAGSETVTTPDLQEQSQAAVPGGDTAPEIAGDSGEQADFATMSDDQKLQYHIDQMGMDAGSMDTKTTGQAPEKKAPETTLPGLQAKTGILGVAQRTGFAVKQMFKGMSVWWKANSTKVYLAMSGILLAAGLVALFTGGAGLIGLLQIMLQVMSAYFIADALIRIRKYVNEWAQKSWDGNPEAGGKSLARGLAVLLNEFLFEFVLKGAGKVLDKVKDMIKASKGVQKGIKVAKKVGSKVPGMGKLGKIKGAVLRGGKYTLTGFKKGWAKGVKTIGELRQRILQRFGFDRIWLKKKGTKIQVWARFNPEFLLLQYTDKNGHKKKFKKPESHDPIHADNRVRETDAYQHREVKDPDSEFTHEVRDPETEEWLGAKRLSPDTTPEWLADAPPKVQEAYKKRGSLRKNMETPDLEEAHHINPMGLMADNPALQTAVQHGYPMNSPSNGINLKRYSSKTSKIEKTGEVYASPTGVHASHPNYTNGLRKVYNDFNLTYLEGADEALKGPMAKKWAELVTSDTRELIKKKCLKGKPHIKVDELFEAGTSADNLYKEVEKKFKKWLKEYKSNLKNPK